MGRAPLLLGLCAVVVASFLLAPGVVERGPVVCAFRALTGLPCPGCGLTRSFVATAHGELQEAFAFHLFGPFLFLGCAAAGLWLLARGELPRSLLRAAQGPLAAAWLCWAAWRLAGTI